MLKKRTLLNIFLFKRFCGICNDLIVLWPIQNVIFWLASKDINFPIHASTHISGGRLCCFGACFKIPTSISDCDLSRIIGRNVGFFKIRATILNRYNVWIILACTILSSIVFQYSTLVNGMKLTFTRFFSLRLLIRLKCILLK